MSKIQSLHPHADETYKEKQKRQRHEAKQRQKEVEQFNARAAKNRSQKVQDWRDDVMWSHRDNPNFDRQEWKEWAQEYAPKALASVGMHVVSFDTRAGQHVEFVAAKKRK